MNKRNADRVTQEAIKAGYDGIVVHGEYTYADYPREHWDYSVSLDVNPETRRTFYAYGQWEDHRTRGSYFTARRCYECCDRCHAETSTECYCKGNS